MLSDIEIAHKAQMKPIMDIAQNLGIDPDDVELYGKYKAKLSEQLYTKLADKKDGKLILVTAINPTPAGEGKTTVSVGLAQAMNKTGRNAVLALREPSLGPVFGIKGGAAGGGYSQVVPMEDINLHFTGICMPLQQQIIFYVRQLITICSREMNCKLIREESFLRDVLT